MRLAILISAVLMVVNVSAEPQKKSSVVYESLKTYWHEENGEIADISLRNERISFDVAGKVVGINDTKFDYQVLESSKWRGITSLGFNFVLPGDWTSKEGASWEYDGLVFRNKFAVALNLNGEKVNVTPIEVINKGSKDAFGSPLIALYSEEAGLVGIVYFTYDPESSSYEETTYLLASSQALRF